MQTNIHKKMRTFLFILLQALTTQETKLRGVTGTETTDLKTIGMSIAALGLLMAGIAVVKKLSKNEPKAMEGLIAWIVALAVYFIVWSLL